MVRIMSRETGPTLILVVHVTRTRSFWSSMNKTTSTSSAFMPTTIEQAFNLLKRSYADAMRELQQIIPRPGEDRPDKPYRTPDRRWEEVTEEIYGSAEEPTNIEFVHNPYWD